MSIIEEVESHDRGISVVVKVAPGTWRATERYGTKADVEVRRARKHFHARPTDDARIDATIDGLQIKKDGTVGSRDRSNVSVWADDVPEDVRVAMIKAAQEAYDKRTVS